MKDFYFEFLYELYNHGIYKNKDISSTLQKYFGNKTDYDDVVWSTIKTHVEKFLKSYKDEGYIEYKNSTLETPFYSDKRWIKSINVTACITPKGVYFMHENLKLEYAYVGNKLTSWFILVTVIIGFLTLIISVMTYNLNKNDNSFNSQILLLKTHVMQQEVIINKQQLQYGEILKMNYRENHPLSPHK